MKRAVHLVKMRLTAMGFASQAATTELKPSPQQKDRFDLAIADLRLVAKTD